MARAVDPVAGPVDPVAGPVDPLARAVDPDAGAGGPSGSGAAEGFGRVAIPRLRAPQALSRFGVNRLAGLLALVLSALLLLAILAGLLAPADCRAGASA